MKTIVMKFGGTSVASNDKLKNIAEIVIKELNKRNIKLNITAVYTAKQTMRILNQINRRTKVI